MTYTVMTTEKVQYSTEYVYSIEQWCIEDIEYGKVQYGCLFLPVGEYQSGRGMGGMGGDGCLPSLMKNLIMMTSLARNDDWPP